MYGASWNRPRRSGSSGFSSSTTTATLSRARAMCGGSESSAAQRDPRSASSVGGTERTASSDEPNRQQPEREPADVREEGDPAAGLGMAHRVAAVDQLEEDPDAEEPERLDLAKDEEEEQGQHPSAR